VAEPVFRDWAGLSSFAGPIETLRVFEDNVLVRQALESEGLGRVLVVDGGGSLRTALIGGRLVVLARESGWSGIIVYGCIRDAVEIGATSVGVRALATSPMKSSKTGKGESGVPVTFAGVTFTPGDWLYADADGMVVADGELPAI